MCVFACRPQGLGEVVAGHSGPAARRHSAILLSKSARRIYYHHHPHRIPNEAAVGTPVGEWTDMVDVRALQPGVELSSRFSPGLQPCHRSNSIRDQENLESLNRLRS